MGWETNLPIVGSPGLWLVHCAGLSVASSAPCGRVRGGGGHGALVLCRHNSQPLLPIASTRVGPAARRLVNFYDVNFSSRNFIGIFCRNCLCLFSFTLITKTTKYVLEHPLNNLNHCMVNCKLYGKFHIKAAEVSTICLSLMLAAISVRSLVEVVRRMTGCRRNSE